MHPYQQIVSRLLLASDASRATLRLATPGDDYPVVAEAVMHGAQQIKGAHAVTNLRSTPIVQFLERERTILVQDDVEHAQLAVPRAVIDTYGVRAQMLAPLTREGLLVGIISVHYNLGPRNWDQQQIDALERAQSSALAEIERVGLEPQPTTAETLKDAAIEATLTRLRQGLSAQRCTLRQDVLSEYAFPVTHESRADGVRSLFGDFTIIQSGQPVIEKLVGERQQVIQNSTRAASTNPAFLTMLDHYGGMRAQIVTPKFEGNKMLAVLSVHDLTTERDWTANEATLARAAADLIGVILESDLTPESGS